MLLSPGSSQQKIAISKMLHLLCLSEINSLCRDTLPYTVLCQHLTVVNNSLKIPCGVSLKVMNNLYLMWYP